MDSLYCQSDPQGASYEVLGLWPQPRTNSVSNATFSTGRSVTMVPQNLLVQNQLHDDFSPRVQLGFNQFLHSFLWW